MYIYIYIYIYICKIDTCTYGHTNLIDRSSLMGHVVNMVARRESKQIQALPVLEINGVRPADTHMYVLFSRMYVSLTFTRAEKTYI